MRNLANKRKLREKIKSLEKRYPIKNKRYQPFLPKWAEKLCSEKEAKDFFLKKENLVYKTGNEKIKQLCFSEGIPIDFKF